MRRLQQKLMDNSSTQDKSSYIDESMDGDMVGAELEDDVRGSLNLE